MSILRKYSKPMKEKEEKEPRTLSVRLPGKLYDQWKEECRKNGYTMSEGLRLLMELDLKGDSVEVPQSITPIYKPVVKPKRTYPSNSTNGFSVVAYVNEDGKTITCPDCHLNVSRANIARHARTKHDKTSRELLEGVKTPK